MEDPSELEELEATLGTVIPMTPLNSVTATPGQTVNSEFIQTPAQSTSTTYESYFTGGGGGGANQPARRQRTASSTDDQPASRATSGSFDITDQYELDDLFSSFDKSEGGRMRSESLMALENLTSSNLGAATAEAASSNAQRSNAFTGLTVTQAAQLTLSQAAALSGAADSSKTSMLMPPPPLPRYGPGGIRMKGSGGSARGGWRAGSGMQANSANRMPTSKKVLTASYLASDEDALSLIPGKCSQEERRAKVDRYLMKRSHRVWEKTIKYNVRKQFAESRPRVGGRFIPKPATQAALYASQLALMGKLEQKLDRRVQFNVKRYADSANQHPMLAMQDPSAEGADAYDSEGTSDEDIAKERKPPLVDFSQDTLIMPKRRAASSFGYYSSSAATSLS